MKKNWIANIKEVMSAYNSDYKAIFTLKPLIGIGAGIVKDDSYDMGMSGAGLASSNAFG